MPFVIAEAGVNHNGDMDLAFQLVDKAVEAKVHAIKFQTFVTDQLVTKNAKAASYQKKNTGSEDQHSILRKLELSFGQFEELHAYCQKSGIMFLSTPFDHKSAVFLTELGVEAFKISSGDLTNLPLIDIVARAKKPLILSTGMSTMDDIQCAVDIVTKHHRDLAILHCTSNYPVHPSNVHLRAMDYIGESYSEFPIGYSDHTEGITIPVAAVARGARIIEKHFTLDKDLPGPDHIASLDPRELKSMMEAIEMTHLSLGEKTKEVLECEVPIKEIAQKGVVLALDCKKGTVLSLDHLTIKRPQGKILPRDMVKVVGRELVRDMNADDVLDWSDFED